MSSTQQTVRAFWHVETRFTLPEGVDLQQCSSSIRGNLLILQTKSGQQHEIEPDDTPDFWVPENVFLRTENEEQIRLNPEGQELPQEEDSEDESSSCGGISEDEREDDAPLAGDGGKIYG